jgi:hypothetical protein
MAGRALPFVLSLNARSTDIIGFLGQWDVHCPHHRQCGGSGRPHRCSRSGNIVLHPIGSGLHADPLSDQLARRRPRARWVSTLRPLLLLQLFFLIALLAVCVVASPRRDANAVLAVTAGMFGVVAMAVQNTLVQISLTNTPTTAVMTTHIAHFMLGLGKVLVGRDRARRAHARARAMRTFR